MRKNSFFKKAIFFMLAVCCDRIVSAQQSAADYQYALNKATSSKTKADICFIISRKYADGLKIDSALHFAEKIKEFSQQENYEGGFGKYHLARAIAFHYRGMEDASKNESGQAIEVFTKQNNYSFLGIAFWQLGFSQHSKGQTTLARKNFWTSAHFLTASGDDVNLFRTYYLLGRSHAGTSDYDSAASYFLKALVLAEKVNDR